MSVTIKLSLVVVVIVIALVAIIIGLIASSLRNLTSDEVGFQYDIHERKLKSEELYQAGLHFGPPGYKFIKFPTLYNRANFPTVTCPNEDGLAVEMDVSYQFRPIISKNNIKNLIEEYRDFQTYSSAVKDASFQSIYDICTRYNVTELQTKRVAFQQQLLDTLTKRLEKDFSTNVRDVQIHHIERPSGFEKIIREKESAQQKIELAYLERERILSLAKSNTRVAEAQANLTLKRAELDANITLSNAYTHGQAIYNVYKKEAETYYDVMVNLNLTVAGVVSYLSTRMVQYAEKPIHINMESPAYTNYRNQSFVYERDLT